MPAWNLYARIVDGKVLTLIMPNVDGVLTAPAPEGDGWHAVKWPLNPHFVGETLLRMLLENAFVDGVLRPSIDAPQASA